MALIASGNCWLAPKEDSAAKFIVIRPDIEPKSPELFVSNNPGDGYNLTFQSLAEFEAWRQQEEEIYTIEFVRGDSHGSRSNPPRFKEHVKLVCARHSRRGRKQYVKKYPERVRKLPNRKIDGTGCPASICYKTYVNTSIVRVMYHREHSHPIGSENLPFTKKGRRILARRNHPVQRALVTSCYSPSTSSGECSSPDVLQATFPSRESTYLTTSDYDIEPEDVGCDQAQSQLLLEQPFYSQLHELQGSCLVENTVATPVAQPSIYTPESDLASGCPSEMTGSPAHRIHTRWDRLAVLFRSVHEHAATFEYPRDTLGELEDVLVRLYFGSSQTGGEFLNDQQSLGLDVIGRSSLQDTRPNRNREPTQPGPIGNIYLPASELSREDASHVWHRPDLNFTYCTPHRSGYGSFSR
ncbi:unnamed protein product [Rhizoctonia solani]|uniref:Uncharacterized protein n=1 Tax=Rhizoctonia solani TaxID=456999 RepID=A0A8H2ZZ10_9AGAM|nr:unnamed protein product [Rhizoctonia solani]